MGERDGGGWGEAGADWGGGCYNMPSRLVPPFPGPFRKHQHCL